MKINIKGFTFVGFAAAIFAMNAMAAATATNTVTSKSYVDAKISSENTIDTESTTTAPNEKAVSDALNGKQDKNNTTTYKVGYNNTWANMTSAVVEKSGDYIDITADGTTGAAVVGLDTAKMTTSYTAGTPLTNNSTNLVTEGVVAQAIADVSSGANSTLQAKSTADFQFGGQSGVWKTVESGTYIAAPVAGTGANSAKIDLDSNKITSTFNSGTGLSDTSTNLIQEGIVAQAIADAIDDANLEDYELLSNKTQSIDTSLDSEVKAANYPSQAAVEDYVQSVVTDSSIVGDGAFTVSINGNSATFNANDSTDSSLTIAGLEETSNKAAAIDTSNNGNYNDSSKYASTKAVYDYVQSVTGGNQIPAQNPEVCTTNHPCALVNEAGALNWRTMAQSGYAGGDCGNLNDNCGDSQQG